MQKQHVLLCINSASLTSDLNPIEILWAYLKRELHKDPTSSIDDLKEKLADIWYNIDSAVVRKLVLSKSERLDAVIQREGGHTKY